MFATAYWQRHCDGGGGEREGGDGGTSLFLIEVLWHQMHHINCTAN